MLIPNSLFWFILNSRELRVFPPLNKRSIQVKRFYRSPEGIIAREKRSRRMKKEWQNCTKKDRMSFSRLMSKNAKNYYNNDPRAQEHRKKLSRSQTESMQKYWDSMSPEEKEQRRQKMIEAHSKVDYSAIHRGYEVEFIESERINDYAGIITESEMRKLLNEK